MGRFSYIITIATAGLVALTVASCATGSKPPAVPTPATASPTRSVAIPGPTCPDRYQGGSATDGLWVPALPQGIDGSAALVPPQTPSAAVVCAYRHPEQGALTGARVLTGDLSVIPATLGSAPPEVPTLLLACPLYIRAVDADDYLIGLRYPTGSLWVAAPGFHCRSSGNGVFVSSENFGTSTASDWYDNGLRLR